MRRTIVVHLERLGKAVSITELDNATSFEAAARASRFLGEALIEIFKVWISGAIVAHKEGGGKDAAGATMLGLQSINVETVTEALTKALRNLPAGAPTADFNWLCDVFANSSVTAMMLQTNQGAGAVPEKLNWREDLPKGDLFKWFMNCLVLNCSDFFDERAFSPLIEAFGGKVVAPSISTGSTSTGSSGAP